ncbi:MAG: hypothetical protein H0V18_09170 [Pyrinomonadaceae bacterium]|nr:hypothetical protein [Pyrinomonadaceae bacterium]
MNKELAYKVQMLPANVWKSRSACETKLLMSGWPKEVLERDLSEAMRWAESHRLVVAQAKLRRTREQKKQKVQGDDALDAMFVSAGAAPASIPRRT